MQHRAGCSTGVLHSSHDPLHGQDQGVLETGAIVTHRVKLHEFSRRLSRFHYIFRQTWSHRHIIAWVSDPLQCVCLEHVKGRDRSPNGQSSSDTRSLSYNAAIPGFPLANTISTKSIVTRKKGHSLYIALIISRFLDSFSMACLNVVPKPNHTGR
ncbi:hypothetical protein Ccrd_025409 [Cynara cardunculus var. scolymus]|uniref:Uncharacterized protein n=1 Tax=Cynara cardunculus var. scolymus TaxID=59895 RepID=A0A103XDM5_CYNCS|nr:hypothetical protein Ccrd_025409 [Cynara cardunculus var. scolymus]